MKSNGSEKINLVKPHILLIGLVLVAFNSYWCLMGTEVWHSTQLTIASLFFNAVFTLLVFVLVNLLLQRFIPRLAMSQADLQTIYVMVVMVTTISGHTMMGYLIPVLAHTFQFATPENEWLSLFGDSIPNWIAVKSPRILDGFYNGDSTLYNSATLNAWIPPVLAWSSFVIALWLTLLAVTVFLRKQWTENERLNYPIVQLPLALTSNPKRFFTSPWMWVGFAVAGSVELLNGLSFLFPEIPSLPIRNKTLGQFSSKPWSAMGTIRVSFYPFSIGLMFFTPLDLSFSCWFFWLLTRLQMVITDMLGARNIYHLEQQTGAWIAFGCIPLWMGRRHYGRIIRKVFGIPQRRGETPPDDSGEPMRYRTAAGLFAVGLMFLFFFCFQMGMTFWAIGLFFLFYFPMILGITRIRAEIGPPLHQLILVDPGRTMVMGLGTRRLGTGNLMGLTFLYPFVRCFRAHPTPSELEAFRLAERSNIGYRQLLIGMILAIVFGILITFWAYLHVLYDMGAGKQSARLDRLYGLGDLQPSTNVAYESARDEWTRTRCYWQQLPVHDIPDDHETPISMVAVTSRRLRISQWHRNGTVMVYNLLGLAGKSDCTETRRRETLSASRAVLFGIDLRRLHARMYLEPHRIGVANTDLYCLALMQTCLTLGTNLCYNSENEGGNKNGTYNPN